MNARDFKRATVAVLDRPDSPAEYVLGSVGDRIVVVDGYDRIVLVPIARADRGPGLSSAVSTSNL